MNHTTALETIRPLLDAASGVSLDDADAARELLQSRFDPAGPAAEELAERLRGHLERGEVADRGELPVRWGRIAKASDETHGYSVDVVYMTGPGPRHRHPKGEIDYAIALDGSPTFDGQAPGWVVLGEDSVHVPTVEGGGMLVVYFLPEGQIEFLK